MPTMTTTYHLYGDDQSARAYLEALSGLLEGRQGDISIEMSGARTQRDQRYQHGRFDGFDEVIDIVRRVIAGLPSEERTDG